MGDLTVEEIEVFVIVQGENSITVRSIGPDVFTLTTEDGPMFGPVPGDRILQAAAALIEYLDDNLELEDAEFWTLAWEEGVVAAVVNKGAENAKYDEFLVDGIVWEFGSICSTSDFDNSSAVIASADWELDDGGGSPGSGDDGTYYLLHIGSGYEVFHQSGGETSHEASIDATDANSAIQQFRSGHGG